MEAKVNLVDLGSISHGLKKGNFIKLIGMQMGDTARLYPTYTIYFASEEDKFIVWMFF